MNEIYGLGKKERLSLSLLLRNTVETISICEAAKILKISAVQAAKILSLFYRKGWLSRISRGIYIPVPIESPDSNIVPDDMFVIAQKLYSPCYIGGWSALEYWGLTDQIFNTLVIITQKIVKNRRPIIKNVKLLIRTSQFQKTFGIKEIWRNNVKVNISDRERTIVDILADPELGGGIRFIAEILQSYFRSNQKNYDILMEYLTEMNNGALYKRLGFLMERYLPQEEQLISLCKERLTKGNTQLDPTLKCDKLISKWHLWVPEPWKKSIDDK